MKIFEDGNFSQSIIVKYFERVVLSILYLLIIIAVVLPYIISESLYSWDVIGHYTSAWFINQYTWPWPDGWNYFFFAGFPQGTFYAPLFHWLVATLGFFIPLKIAFKLLVVSSILAFPAAAYFVSKRLLKDQSLTILSTIVICAIYLIDFGVSGSMVSGITIGLTTQFFSYPIFIFFIYYLVGVENNRFNQLMTGLLLALCIVTHVYTGLFAALILIGVVLMNIKNRLIFWQHVKTGLLAFFLSAWYLIPFIVNSGYISGSSIKGDFPRTFFLLAPFGVFFSMQCLWRWKNENKVLVVSSLMFLLFVLASLFPGGFGFDLPVHIYRNLFYSFLLMPIVVINFFSNKNINAVKVSFAALAFLFFYYFTMNYVPVGPQEMKLMNLTEPLKSGRMFFTGGSEKLDYRMQSGRHLIPLQYGATTDSGLFVESSINGWFVQSLLSTYYKNSFVWGYSDIKNASSLDWATKIFNINYEYHITDDILQADMIKNQPRKDDLQYFNQRQMLQDNEVFHGVFGKSMGYYEYIFKVNDSHLIETVSQQPINITDNWKGEARRWWEQKYYKKGADLTMEDEKIMKQELADKGSVYQKPLLVKNVDTSSWQVASSTIGFEPSSHNDDWTEFKIDVPGQTDVPVYIKISYFPYWQARNEMGEKIEIHRASPNFMMVYGHGKINFSYEKPWYYYLGYCLSGLTLAIIILVRVVYRNNGKRRNMLS